MSYTIVYGRQFLRTSRGIVPLALYGDNNVWEWNNKRRARSWGIFYSESMLELPDKDFMEFVRELHSEHQKECFKFGGKWVDGKGAIKFFANGVKAATTIENIVKCLPHQSLRCFLSVYRDLVHSTELMSSGIRTTEDLEAWIDKARIRKAELSDCYASLRIEFEGTEPIRLGLHPDVKGAVIAKVRNSYVYEYETNKSMSFGSDIMRAVVFESVEDAISKLGSFCLSQGVRFIKAENQKVKKEYALIVDDGLRRGEYIKKLTKGRAYLTYSEDFARRFASEKAAMKYFDTKIRGRFPGIISCRVKYLAEAV